MLRILSLIIIISLISGVLIPSNSDAADDSGRTIRKMRNLADKYQDGINRSNRDDFIGDLTGENTKSLKRKARKNLRQMADDAGIDVTESDRTAGQYTVKKKRKKSSRSRYYTGKNGRPPHGQHRRSPGNNASSGMNN